MWYAVVFNVPWIGVTPINTTGEDLTVGSTRTMPLGPLIFIEEIVESWKAPNGGFELVVAQHNGTSPLLTSNQSEANLECSTSFVGNWERNLLL